MPFSNTTQTNIAFKNLSGKSETTTAFDISSEVYGISFNLTSNNIWLNQIPSSPTQAIANGVAIAVTASMVLISSSGTLAYSVNWPTTVPSGVDLATNLPFQYNVGSLIGITASTRIKNAISDSYGALYSPRIVNQAGALIPSSDSRNWIYQYNSGIYFQENAGSSNPSTASVYVYIGSTLLSQPNSPYTNASASEVNLGGLNSGLSFSSVFVNDILDSVLYPSTKGNINLFQIQNLPLSYEVGNGISVGSYTMSWSASNISNLILNQTYIISHTGSVVYGPTNNFGPISGYTPSNSNIILTTPGVYTWQILSTRNSNIHISSSFSINWYYGTYYGYSTQSGLTNSFSTNLQSKKISNTFVGNYTMFSGNIPSYKYLIIPDTYGSINSITWRGMPVAMADNYDGYTFSANDLNYKLQSFTNIYSVTANYKIYRTKYLLGATMSNVIIL